MKIMNNINVFSVRLHNENLALHDNTYTCSKTSLDHGISLTYITTMAQYLYCCDTIADKLQRFMWQEDCLV